MKDDNSEGALGELKKITKIVSSKKLQQCARPGCDRKFEQRTNKKYCNSQCQWTHYNNTHPVLRKK